MVPTPRSTSAPYFCARVGRRSNTSGVVRVSSKLRTPADTMVSMTGGSSSACWPRRTTMRRELAEFSGNGRLMVMMFLSSPIVDRTVVKTIDGQVCGGIRVFGGQILVELNAQARGITGMEEPPVEGVGGLEDLESICAVRHVLLDAEIVDGQAQVQVSSHSDRGDIGRTVHARADAVDIGEVEDLLQAGYPAGVGRR